MIKIFFLAAYTQIPIKEEWKIIITICTLLFFFAIYPVLEHLGKKDYESFHQLEGRHVIWRFDRKSGGDFSVHLSNQNEYLISSTELLSLEEIPAKWGDTLIKKSDELFFEIRTRDNESYKFKYYTPK